jgi:hypothetical protein
MNLRLWQLQLSIFLVWLICIVGYGYLDVAGIMNELRITPSTDLYANDLGFQVLAFALTKGLASFLVLGIALWSSAYASRSRQSRSQATCTRCRERS